jgi:hypothetical protein
MLGLSFVGYSCCSCVFIWEFFLTITIFGFLKKIVKELAISHGIVTSMSLDPCLA